MGKPKYSVCIPTRDRHQTLPFTIRSVLQQTYQDFEVVVQDNFSGPETEAAVKEFDDARLIYHRSDERLPMHDNWEDALNQTSGDYVIFIGDDDALMPNCLESVTGLIADHDVGLLAWLAHLYYWPDVPDVRRRNHLSLDMRSAAAWAPHFATEKAELDLRSRHEKLPDGTFCLNSRRILRNWLAYEGVRVYVPTYHNLVSRRTIEKVRALVPGGVYFFNPLPDYGTLIANLFVEEEVFFHAAPLSMTGHSGRSAGGTHGDQDSWNRSLERFMSEARMTPDQFLPPQFKQIAWSQPILAGCFNNVKQALFPEDTELAVNWANFLKEASAQVNSEPEVARAECREWVTDSWLRIGRDPGELDFPPPQEWVRKTGLQVDPHGVLYSIFVDGDRMGMRSILDAVDFAASIGRSELFPTQIPEPQALVAAAAESQRSKEERKSAVRLKKLEDRIIKSQSDAKIAVEEKRKAERTAKDLKKRLAKLSKKQDGVQRKLKGRRSGVLGRLQSVVSRTVGRSGEKPKT